MYTPLRSDNVFISKLLYVGDNAPAVQQQAFHNRLDQGAAQVDFGQPVGKKSRFETGVKSTWRRYDNQYDFASTQPILYQQSVFLYQ